MTFAKTISKRTLIVAGLNSGTSVDGLDLAALKITDHPKKNSISFIKGSFKRYPDKLRREILRIATSKTTTLEQLIYLDNLLGQFYGQAAKAFIRRLARAGIKVDALGSHGQTVRHAPQKRELVGKKVHGTLQIGSPEQIATITNLPVISDFRQAAVALGQEGAPITVAAMERIFANPKESRLILNIGGMANYFYFPSPTSTASTRAADCGPGNSLIDCSAELLYGQPFDRGGRLAAQGKINQLLLARLKRHKFFAGGALSTGREEFGLGLARKIIRQGREARLSKADIIATISEMTVYGIAKNLKPLLASDKMLTKLYLTGGGVHNNFIWSRLQIYLKDIDLLSIARLGYDPDLVEASAYAVMAAATLKSSPMQSLFAGDRKQKIIGVLGRITQPPVRIK